MLIVFYNFNYELYILRNVGKRLKYQQQNGMDINMNQYLRLISGYI